tara:strand:+ start:1323 stop:1784 length:462 start_codon:yes stop_codon:yes gene_type:complete
MVSFTGLLGKAVTAAVTSGASTIAKVGAAKAGQALFGGGSSGRSVGVNAAIANPKNVQSIITDDDPDFQRTSLGASGFVKGISDYRSVGASNVRALESQISDSGLQRIISSMMNSPPASPDVRASILGSMASPRSVVSNSDSKKFRKYLKGLS